MTYVNVGELSPEEARIPESSRSSVPRFGRRGKYRAIYQSSVFREFTPSDARSASPLACGRVPLGSDPYAASLEAASL